MTKLFFKPLTLYENRYKNNDKLTILLNEQNVFRLYSNSNFVHYIGIFTEITNNFFFSLSQISVLENSLKNSILSPFMFIFIFKKPNVFN